MSYHYTIYNQKNDDDDDDDDAGGDDGDASKTLQNYTNLGAILQY